MSSIYKVGTSVVCPSAGMHGDKPNVVGNIQAIKSGSVTPYIKWSDGVEGYTLPGYLITKEKYDQLHDAGYSDKQISEYIRMFNGHIYN